MISFIDAVKWFYQESDPGLHPWVRMTVNQMRSGPAAQAAYSCRLLLSYASCPDPLDEAGEVMTYCAIYALEHGQVDDAEQLFEDALAIFMKRKDDLKQALLNCLLYHLYLPRNDRVELYQRAHEALSRFLSKAQYYHMQTNPGLENRLREPVEEIALELLTSPRDVYELLNEFTGSALLPSALQVQNEIRKMINSHRREEAYQNVRGLLSMTRRSLDYRETAEAFTFTGWAAEEMDHECLQPSRYYQAGIAHYAPGSHQQIFTRWMLGLHQFDDPVEHCEAIITFERCIRETRALAESADCQNNIYRRLWYECFAAAMRKFVEERVKAYLPPSAGIYAIEPKIGPTSPPVSLPLNRQNGKEKKGF